MKSYKSFITSVLVALALCLVQMNAAAQALKIGVQLPLTGERADVGKLMQNALQMASDKINSQAGASAPKLQLVWADDESTQDGTVKALNTLVRDPQIVAIAGEINSPLVLASKPIVEQEKVPYLTGGTSPRSTQQAEWIFRVAASDALLTDSLTQYVADKFKGQNVAILHDKTGIHNARAGLIATALQDKNGMAPVLNATWSPGDTDFSSLMEQVKAKNAQVIIALGETPEAGPFFKAVKASGVHAQIITHRDFGVKPALEAAGDAAEGAVVFTEYAPDLQGKATQDWAKAYNTRFGSPANVIAAQYYDALLLISEAMKKSGPTRAGIKTGLEQLKSFPGVLADYTFDSERNGVHRFYVAKVVGGKLTQVTIVRAQP